MKRRHQRPGRFIPARARDTRYWPSLSAATPAHPRACGEHLMFGHERKRKNGSSPRVRGTHRDSVHSGWAERFIPARAGNTFKRRARPVRTPVHPRACWEHERRRRTNVPIAGSSPRVRGTLKLRAGRARLRRFIPARAGNTCCEKFRSIRTSVHPRACGEHAWRARRLTVAGGSSPRVRGTRHRVAGCQPLSRFIPARAGNTPRPILAC